MKILLAVDGSKYSNWTVELILNLPLKTKPYITLLHVLDMPTHRVPLVPDLTVRKDFINKLRRKKISEARKLVAPLEDNLKERFSDVKSEIVEANVAEGIIERASRRGMDLIVVGSRGASDIRTFFLGGASQRVATYSPCSVLLVKKRVQRLKRILLAVDGSSYSKASVDFLKSAFSGEGMEITVLNSWDLPVDPPEKIGFIDEYCRELKEAGFKAIPVCVKGNPARTIINESRKRKSGLVIMGSKGLRGLKMFLLGSTSRKVMTYGETSVLLLRGI